MKASCITRKKIILNILLFTMIFLNHSFFYAHGSESTIKITKLGSFDTGQSAFDLIVIDDVAFVTDDYTGFFIINVSDPTNPTQLSHVYIHQSYGLWIEGNHAFIGSFSSGLSIYDINNLSNPVLVGEYFDGGNAADIQVVGNLVFIADYSQGLEILNITNLASPVEIGNYTEGDFINNVHVQENVAYITVHFPSQDSQLVVLNVSNPGQIDPILHGNLVNDSATIHVSEDLVFLSSWFDGLSIFNFSEISNPVELGTYDVGGITSGAYYYEDMSLVFLGRYSQGFVVLDISNPSNPVMVGEFYDGGGATNIQVINDLIYVADKNDGLEIFKFENIDSTNKTSSYYCYYLLFVVITFPIFKRLKKKRK